MTAVALTIAGSDPSGGAGLQADLKTFHQHGVYGMSVVTVLTVQSTAGVRDVRCLDAPFVDAQLEAVLADILPLAAKTGALGSAAVIEAVAARAAGFDFPLVVDPVLVSKHGDALAEPDAVRALRERLFPHAFLVTPNAHEAAVLTGMTVADPDAMERAAQRIAAMGPKHVLVTGGSLPIDAVDVLLDDNEIDRFETPRDPSRNTHGSGCALSAAITARLARGESLHAAVHAAKAFVTEAIRTAPGLGSGVAGPTNLHARAGR